MVLGWLKTFFYLALFYYLFFSGGSSPDTTFKHSMAATRDYPHQITSSNLGINYYVNEKFLNLMKKNSP